MVDVAQELIARSAEDEIGMLNLIDAASRDAIMKRADASRVYDLSVDNFVGMPGWISTTESIRCSPGNTRAWRPAAS